MLRNPDLFFFIYRRTLATSAALGGPAQSSRTSSTFSTFLTLSVCLCSPIGTLQQQALRWVAPCCSCAKLAYIIHLFKIPHLDCVYVHPQAHCSSKHCAGWPCTAPAQSLRTSALPSLARSWRRASVVPRMKGRPQKVCSQRCA